MQELDLPAVGGKATEEERRSATGVTFVLPPEHRRVWRKALRALNAAGVPYVVTGALGLYQHTGIWRNTKDMDLLLERTYLDDALAVLERADFACRIVDEVWLAKAYDGEIWVDLLFGSGNGLIQVDSLWYTRSKQASVAGIPTRIVPPEDLLWMKAFVAERHRFDGPDVVHLINEVGHLMDWEHVLWRFGEHWKLLAIHIMLFDFIFPGRRDQVPRWIRRSLLERMKQDVEIHDGPVDLCLGALVSRFSYLANLRQKGYSGPPPGNALAWYLQQASAEEAPPPAA